MAKRKQDSTSGKFVKSENDFNEIYALRCSAEFKNWLKEMGSDFVRSVLERERSLVEGKRSKKFPHQQHNLVA